jgi:uncharacterized protein YqgV (UPF0045/DUF77 family)
VEGEWGQIIELARRCHTRVKESMPHVVTILKIDDDATKHDTLGPSVMLVKNKAHTKESI